MSGNFVNGVKVKIGDVNINEITNVSGPNISADSLDSTTHNNSTKFRNFEKGLIDGGEINIDGLLDSSEYVTLETASSTLSSHFTIIEIPDILEWKGDAIVTNLETGMPHDGLIEVSVNLKIKEKPLFSKANPSFTGELLEIFENESDWVVGGNGEVENDTNNKTIGIQSIRLYAETTGEHPYADKSVNINLSDMETISIKIYIEDIDAMDVSLHGSPIALFFGQNTFTDCVYVRNITEYNYTWRTGWNYVKWHKDDFTIDGAATFDSTFNLLRIRCYSKVGEYADISFDNLRKNEERQPCVILYWDDGFNAVHDSVLVYSAGKDIKHTIPIVKNWVDTDDYMNFTKIKACFDAGHDIINHSTNHTNLTTLTETKIYNEIVECREYLRNNGFDKSSDFFAIPYSAYNDTVIKKSKQAGVKITRINRTGIVEIPHESLHDQKVLLVTIDTTTTTNIKNTIDIGIKYKTTVVIMNHDVQDVPATEYEMSTAVMQYMIDYINLMPIKCLTISEWYDKYFQDIDYDEDMNLLPNVDLIIDEDSDGKADAWERTFLQASTTATFSIDGGQKIEITASPSAGVALSYLDVDKVVRVFKNISYKYSFEAKKTGDVSIKIQIDTIDALYTYIDTMEKIDIYTNEDWETIEYEFTIPDDDDIKYIATKLTVAPNANDNLGSGWFRNVRLIKI